MLGGAARLPRGGPPMLAPLRSRPQTQAGMSKLVPRLVPLLLLTAPAAAQLVPVPVHDLVLSEQLVLPEEQESRALHWIWRGRWNDDDEHPKVMGEGALLRASEHRPLFQPGALLTVLSHLGGIDGEMDIRGGVLLVDADGVDTVKRSLAHLRGRLPPRVKLALHLERVSGDGSRESLLRVEERVRAGRTATFRDLLNRRALTDFDVEIAQASTIANPVVVDLSNGACLAVRPSVVPGRGEAILEVFARVANDVKAEPMPRDAEDVGPIERAACQFDECGVSMRLPRAANRTVEWTAADGGTMRLTCSVDWADAPRAPGNGAIALCNGLFHLGISEFRTELLERDEPPEGFPTEASLLSAGAEGVSVPDVMESAVQPLVVTGAKADQLAADVATRLERTIRAFELQVAIYSVAAGEELPSDARPLARVASPVVMNKLVAFSGRTEIRYVHDWDVEVAQSSRIPDPKIMTMRHGYHVDARVVAGPEGRASHVAIDASIVRLLRIAAKKVRIAKKEDFPAVDSASLTNPSAAPRSLPEIAVWIESPELQRHRVSALLDLDEKGSATLRRAAPRLLGKGRDLVVVVKTDR